MNDLALAYSAQAFGTHSLALDANAEVDRIASGLRQAIHGPLHRQGAVVGISGGVDSAVVLALCVRALGAKRVLGVLLPERESSPDSAALALSLADQYGVATITEDITGALEGVGCYSRRDAAVSRVFPEFGPGWKSKIVLPGSLLAAETLNVFTLVVVSPDGQEYSKRLPLAEYYQVVAASNFKQRTRMAMLYYHAEVRNYAVVGTANKNEHDLGFFVKHGDGGADVQPVVHLFKSQIYQLAEQLGVPEEIRLRTPTSDTYSAGSSQEEFFFRLPFDVLDLIWCGHERGLPAGEIAEALGLDAEQVERVTADITRKQRTTSYLRMPAVRLEND